MSSNYQQKKMMNARGAIDTKGNIVLEQFQDGTSLKDSLDAQYKADERGRVFDRPCQVLDDGDLDEH